MIAVARAPWALGLALLSGCPGSTPADGQGSDSSTSGGGTTGAGTTGSGTTPGTSATTSPDTGGASTDEPSTTDADTTGAGDSSTGALRCPTAPPFDHRDAALVEQCTRPIYIEGGDDSRVTISTDDGASWTSVRIDDIDGDDFVNEVFVANGIVAVVGKFGLWVDLGEGFVLASAVSNAGFDSYGGQLGLVGDQILLTDNSGTFASSDGSDWLALDPFPDDSHPPGFGGHHHGTGYGDPVYLVFQDQGYRRFDGDAWSESTLPGQAAASGVVYGNGMFVVVGYENDSGFTRTSSDGIDWSPAQTLDGDGNDLGNPDGIVFDGSEFSIYTEYSNVRGYRSADGASWSPIDASHHVDRVAFDGGRYFGVGEGKLLGSDDGVTWDELYVLAVDETNFINGARVAIGRVLQ
jgi:hypothetical protein